MLCTNLNESYLAKDNLRSGTEAFKILGIVAKRFDKQVDVYERLFPVIYNHIILLFYLFACSFL